MSETVVCKESSKKFFEEAPAYGLSQAKREELGELALKVAKLSQYSGVGTVEFLLSHSGEIYFLEMNTRIQVEHPVTEMISGVDLICEQFKTACGQKLMYKQADIKLTGWSMEARINAEKIGIDIYPSSGQISFLTLPSGPFVRCDTHLYTSYEVPSDYDSLLLKLIVWGRDRTEVKRMLRALMELEVSGVETNQSLHQSLLLHPSFDKAHFHTQFLEEKWEELISPLELKLSKEKKLEEGEVELALLSGFAWQQDHSKSLKFTQNNSRSGGKNNLVMMLVERVDYEVAYPNWMEKTRSYSSASVFF